MCKKFLITVNHDACVLNYVNGMNSRGKKQKANVLNIANQTRLKLKVRKPNQIGVKERLASPKPSQPRTCLRWSPTRRISDLKGKIIASIKSECQSEISVGRPNLFMVRRLRVLKAYDRKSEASNKHCPEVLRNPMYDDYIGGQPSATKRTVPDPHAPQVLQILTASTTTADTDVDELETRQQHVQQQNNQSSLQPEIVTDNVSNAMLDENLFVNLVASPSISAAESSSSQYVDPSNMHTFYQPYPHEYHTMEPGNVKEDMKDPAWIDSMLEEILQFKWLNVWVLVPAPDNINSVTLKWLFKNKHDEREHGH
ncbi:hypothetical protein Tco_0736455 [Tanacetum coccineum]